MAISDEITRLQNAKSQIKTAIENKGVTVPEGTTLDGYSPLINEIETQGEYQSKSVVPSKDYQLIKPDEGYDALSSVLVAETPLEEKTVTPTTGGLIVEPDGENIGLSKVTVEGDFNLTSSNIKNGVTIFGVTGTFEGSGGGGGDNFSSLGNTVSVEARTSFVAGDRFVGVKNDGYAGLTLQTLNLGVAGITVASEDLNVIVPSGQTILTENGVLQIAFNTGENIYEIVDINLPSLPSTPSGWTINEDGSYIIAKCGLDLLKIDTDFENKTATARLLSNPLNWGNYVENDVSYSTTTTGVGSIALTKNYLVASITFTYNSKTTTISTIFHISGNYFGYAIANINALMGATPTISHKTMAWANDSTIIFVAETGYTSKIVKLVLSNGNLISSSSASTSLVRMLISKNARYITSRDKNGTGATMKVYQLDPISLSLTEIYSTTGNGGYEFMADSTGSYAWRASSAAILSIKGTGNFTSNLGSVTDWYFEVLDGGFYRSGTQKKYISPQGDEAEYLITNNTGDATTTDRIYGIVPKNMVMGEIGTARGLFRT